MIKAHGRILALACHLVIAFDSSFYKQEGRPENFQGGLSAIGFVEVLLIPLNF